jgi:hypothetical protein
MGFFKNNMNRPLIFLIIVGGLIAGGIILSFYSSQLTTQNILVKEENILPDSSLEVSIELDPSVGDTGVFAVVVIENFEKDTISFSVFDPLGSKIISKIAEKESTEERFEITSGGTYKLETQNSGIKESKVVVGLGYMPDEGTRLIGVMGTAILISGLIGIVGIGVYSIRNRQKNKLS